MVVKGTYRSSAELRRKPRRPFQYSAKILLDKKGTMIKCLLLDISETGARIALETDRDIPEHFALLLTSKGEAHRRCRLIWKDGMWLGVEFIGLA